MRGRALVVAAFVAGVVAVGAMPATAQVAPEVMQVRGGAVVAVGQLTADDYSLGAAIASFGEPARRDGEGSGCRVDWPALGLRTTFADFGGGDACDAEDGSLQRLVVRAPSFRTTRGVQVGTRLADLRRVHPRPRRDRLGDYVLYSQACRIGDCVPGSRIPFVTARVKRGVVTALIAFVGAAGD